VKFFKLAKNQFKFFEAFWLAKIKFMFFEVFEARKK
jgi:hypothetical protein